MDMGIISPSVINNEGHAFHLFVVLVDNRLGLYNYLKEHNIHAQIHYIPVYKFPFYNKTYKEQYFNNAEEYYKKCISLPLYPSLTIEEQEKVIKRVQEFYTLK